MDNSINENGNTPKCIETKVLTKGHWLEMNKITYENSNGKQRMWEAFSRTTRPKTTDTDCVGVLAVLKRTLRRDCYILVSQFRPALNAYTIETPAGLIREEETPEQAALRELREETGYIGVVKFVGPPLAVDPGISNSIMRMVTVEIDGDIASNVKPVQRSADQDDIQVYRVPTSELLEKLLEFSKQGMIIDSRLQAFSLGLVKGAPKHNLLKPAESVDEK